MPSKFKRLLVLSFIFGAIFLTVGQSLAAGPVDVGTSTVDSALVLSNKSPLQIVTNIINVLMGLLSLVAVCLILWGGFIWMTSNGSEEKISQARKILRNGAIGLLIILSAWGIAYFILNKLVDATTGSGNGADGCSNGANMSCGCGGGQTCIDGTWGPCLGSTCQPIVDSNTSCDGKPAVSQCQADNNLCGPDYVCDDTDCLCKPRAGLGDSCNATPNGGKCTADNNLCGPYLKCDTKDCVCVGPPVITGISPSGGFCSNDQNRGCNLDSDCQNGAKCDVGTPNGAANNFLTIYGYNFGTTSKLFENILTNIDFEQGAVGAVPTDWTPAYQQHSNVGIVTNEFKSGKQSVRLHQDPNLDYPGTCNKATCQDMGNCSWVASDKTCHFAGIDQAHQSGPAVYHEGETLVWGNSYNVMWAKLTYNLAHLNFKPGETYSIQFYYKGKTSSDVSISTASNLGWTSMCAGYDYYASLKPGYTWDGSKVVPTPPEGEDPCAFGKTCSEQSNTCCVNAPYQKKCYNGLYMTGIPAGTTNDWTLYSYTFQYTPEMDTWFDSNGNKAIEIGLSIGYNPTGSGTDFYIDDFTVTKILNTGQVTFLGANPGQSQLANFPKLLNPNCISSWTDRQIIIAVPSGAATGPIQVKREGDLPDNIDVSNNEVGPKIPDFVKNNIYRPGLCLVSPTQGVLGDKVVYQGINLKNGAAYFGQYSSAYKGINSNFLTDNLSGQTLAPSIMAGQTTTFVEKSLSGINQQSNALMFIKDRDKEAGPYISSFSPMTGQSGQYVTIKGSGFGNMRGSRQVFFGDKEASYVFPEVCANSIWSDGQIIVKVPEGLNAGSYGIKINLGNNDFINTDLLSPNNTFNFNPAESLKTSLCKIDPVRGQIGDKVNLWGEYFGNEGTDASVVFSRNIGTSSKITKDGQADKIQTVVPTDSSKTPAVPAITGPVHVMKNGEWGNELNFVVGKCANNSECGASSPICCPDNTYKSGSCADTLLTCYFSVPNSVYETKFDTIFSNSSDNPFDSCAGMAVFYGGCQTGQFCPNSPGKCSPSSPGQPEVLNDCGGAGSQCNALTYCKDNPLTCNYNKAKDVCQANTCQLEGEFEYPLPGYDTEFKGTLSCRAYVDKFSGQKTYLKQLKVTTSCPEGWLNLGSGYCTPMPMVACEPCPSNFKCVDNGAGDNLGTCESDKICASGATCEINPSDPNKFSCLKASGKKSCDCCCEIGQDTRDCCAPLKCAGTCGSDTTDDGSGYGSCSGCADVGNSQVEHDAACNCSTASGKFCQIDDKNKGGICVDCASLDAAGCSLHSEQCCFDSTKNTCQGGDGTVLPGGKCAYYDCDSADKTQCNLNATTTGQFLATSTCATSCAKNPQTACDLAGSDSVKCSALGSCCFDSASNKCLNGTEKINLSGINYCSYYNCTSGNIACDLSSASTTGQYLGTAKCQASCQPGGPTSPGSTCASDVANSCNISFCGDPYSCLSSAGSLPSTNDCGFCCCKPGDKDGSLTCVADKGSCTGGSRGLFCGCKSDSECSNSASQGCGADTCCHGRPNVRSTSPINGQEKVCRNSQIVVNFDQLMNTPTLAANILLIEEKEYGKDTCANGTILSFDAPKKSTNIFARLYGKFTDSLKSIFRTDHRAIAAMPNPDKLYCITPAVVESQETFTPAGATSTSIYIRPQKILSPKTNYFVVVKGDENLDSNSGVVSAEKVGLNASGYSPIPGAQFNQVDFKNSYAFGFTTLEDTNGKNGLCTVNSVTVSPNSFLIKNPDNDSSDDNPAVATFDTKSDNDRMLYASAYSADNQLLQPVTGYYWNWNWKIEDASVAKNLNTVGLSSNQIVVGAMAGVTDKSTKVSAEINMGNFSSAANCASGNCVCSGADCSNKCCNASFDGNGINGWSSLYVFLCANPWPVEKSGIWNPWTDKCIDASGNLIPKCTDYNYKFYYCRDAGAVGTADDLPAVMDPALILGSSSLVCSVGGASCQAQNAPCGSGGTCIWSVLKESYFFREAIPQSGEITEVRSTGAGGQVVVSWYAPLNLSAPLASFKIYYGLVSGKSSSYIKTLSLKDANCNVADGKEYCSYIIDNLVDGQNYYFKVSSISDKKTESPLYGSKEAIPTDLTAPAKPTGLKAELMNDRLKISWNANSDDTLFYRLYHGLFSGKVADSIDSPNKAVSMDFDQADYRAGDHFFYLSAIDKSGNVSPMSSELKVNIPNQ